MPDKRIIAVGLLTRNGLQTLGPAFDRLWPVEDAPCFPELLQAIDDVDRGLDPRPQATAPAMTDDHDGLYFAECERRERGLSRRASDPRIAAAHAEMADRYEALAVVFGAKHPIEVPGDYH